MEDLVISESDVKKLLLEVNINKAMGPDDIHPKLINFLAQDNNFVTAITKLFNTCLQQETIPNIWKTALVIPLHKKGSVHEPNNYRPVSLTCILCKIYEKLIRKHLLIYVSGIISSKQHGFVPGKSCLSNLLEAIEAVHKFLSEESCADILYFDFAKAFDSVPHYRLLTKLQAMGINQQFINIISNFLTDRTMKVKVGKSISEPKPVLSGVPQGSVLGPLLFLLFINDLPESVKSIVKLFADDLKMIVSPYDFGKTQLDLSALHMWESKWLLKFNLEKCYVLYLGKYNPHNVYKLSGTVLNETKKEKDLGIPFNDQFNFNDAISALVAKAKSTLFWFLRNTVSRESHIMVKAFKCIVRPHIEYCCQAWAPKARHGNWAVILELENVQRLFSRMVRGMDNLPYRARLNKLGLTTLLERRMRGDLIEVYKILNDFTNYGKEFFNLSQRTGNLVVRPNTKTMDFFSERVINLWNKLPEYVKKSVSVNSFKNNFDKFRKNGILNNLSGRFWELSEEIFRRI
jgi:ribonuclease P/MRP protein subunit RPP40